jgi:hypothetical protein
MTLPPLQAPAFQSTPVLLHTAPQVPIAMVAAASMPGAGLATAAARRLDQALAVLVPEGLACRVQLSRAPACFGLALRRVPLAKWAGGALVAAKQQAHQEATKGPIGYRIRADSRLARSLQVLAQERLHGVACPRPAAYGPAARPNGR